MLAFCNTDARLKYVDVAVPCNTRSVFAIGLMWWLLTREVLRLRGLQTRTAPWSVVPDLFFYRDPDEVRLEEEVAQAQQAQLADERRVRELTDAVAAVALDADVATAATKAQAGETDGAKGADATWPDMFQMVDWNEEVPADGAAMKATWGGAGNGLF